MTEKTIKPGTRVERTIAVERAVIDTEHRSVELAFSSETPYERWWGIEILDHDQKSISLDRLKESGPLLVDHDARDIVGVIESVRIDSDRVGRAVVRFGKSARAEEVYQDVLDGIRKSVSVGYLIHEAKLVETKNETDTYRITRWEPYEVSLVACPADPSVGINRGLNEDSPVIAVKTPDPIQENQMQEQVTPAVDASAIEARASEAARTAELRRVNDILEIGAQHEALDLARAAVKGGQSVADFQRQLLDARRDAQTKVTFENAAQVRDNLLDDQKRGFRDYGEFAAAIQRAAAGSVDERLTRAATTYGNEGSGPDGGYAVPPEFAREIASVAYSEESLLSRCDATPIAGNSLSFPKDETMPWGTTGIYAGWEGEGSTGTARKPVLGETTLKLRKLKVLVPASEELLADAPAMASYLTRKMGEAVEWKVNDAIVNGTGAGMPLGILNAGSLVAQAKESGQAADTITAANVAKMYGRCIIGAGANVVWLMNPDAFAQVITLSLNSNPIWVPANGGFQGAPNGLLLGRPIVLTDACDTVGDQGDIILANLSGYRAITKAAGAEFAQSMHLYFDQDLTAFRLTFRMDGQPTLTAAVTPPNSAVTRSHFVALAERT